MTSRLRSNVQVFALDPCSCWRLSLDTEIQESSAKTFSIAALFNAAEVYMGYIGGGGLGGGEYANNIECFVCLC